MLVLREDDAVGERTETETRRAELDMRGALAAAPQVDAVQDQPAVEHVFCEPDLAVKFERSCLNGERPRGGPGSGCGVDHPRPDPELRQDQRQKQAGGAGANDQHVARSFAHTQEPGSPEAE